MAKPARNAAHHKAFVKTPARPTSHKVAQHQVTQQVRLGEVTSSGPKTVLESAKFAGMNRLWWVGSSPGEGTEYHPTTFDAGDIEAAAPGVRVVTVATGADHVEQEFLQELANLVAQPNLRDMATAAHEIDLSSLLEP